MDVRLQIQGMGLYLVTCAQRMVRARILAGMLAGMRPEARVGVVSA